MSWLESQKHDLGVPQGLSEFCAILVADFDDEGILHIPSPNAPSFHMVSQHMGSNGKMLPFTLQILLEFVVPPPPLP